MSVTALTGPAPPSTPRVGLKWVAIGTLVLSTVAAVIGASILGQRVKNQSGNNTATAFIIVCLLVVGLVLSAKRPRNPIGWLFLASADCFVVSGLAGNYSIVDYQQDHGTLPLGWLSLLGAEFWAPAILLFSLSVLFFPDGRARSRVTRGMIALLLTTGTAWQLGAFAIAIDAVLRHRVVIDKGGDLYAIDHAVGTFSWWNTAIQPLFFLTLAVVWIAWLLMQIPLYRRTAGDRRLQLKWLYGGVAVTTVGGVLTAGASGWGFPSALNDVGTALLGALPLSVGISVLKYRLYEVDKVVSRTISYALVSGVVVAGYVGAIALLTKALGLSSPVAVATSTLLAALAFNPIRRRMQRAVDRRFNRARYDAEATVLAFAARLRGDVELESVRAHLLSVVASSMEPAQLGVWVVNRAASRPGRGASAVS